MVPLQNLYVGLLKVKTTREHTCDVAITFDAAASKHYLDVAYQAGWAGVIRQSPELGPKLQALFAKAR